MKRVAPILTRPLSIFILLGMVTILAAVSRMGSIEREVFEAIYELSHPLAPALLVFTQLGSIAMWLVSVVVAYAAKQRRVSLQLALSGGLAVAMTVMLKILVSRPRPFDVLDAITQYDRLASGYGYPSGHTAIAVCLAMVLWPVWPHKSRWVLPVLACVVAVSRVGLGVHAPLDILGGALIAVFVTQLVKKYYPLTSKSRKNKS